MKIFLIVFTLFCATFFIAPSLTHAITLTPNQRAAIRYARLHGFLTPAALRSATNLPSKKQSLLSKLWTTVEPGILGSAGVGAGAVIAWYTLRKKKKTFNTYYEQIQQAQQKYLQNLQSGVGDKTQAKSSFKKELTLIQEQAELNAAQKKLDQEQLTAIINKVQRMKEEISS